MVSMFKYNFGAAASFNFIAGCHGLESIQYVDASLRDLIKI